MTTAGDEAPRTPTGPDFSDAIAYGFGDPDGGLFGLARIGLSPDPEGDGVHASGLALLFAGREPVAVRAAGGLPVAPAGSWDVVEAAGIGTREHAPLQRWDVRFTGDDGTTGFALRFEALSAPATLAPDDPAALAGGMQGYEQLCRVTGVATVAGDRRAIDCLGQRGHTWGAPDWSRMALTRSVTAWLDDGFALTAIAVRPRGAASHAEEALSASVFLATGDDAVLAAVPAEEARLSTTSDADGRQRRAGLEVFLDEDDPGQRAAGEALCGTSLDLGRLRLDCAFFAWRGEGLTGVGRYDVLRVAP